MVDKKTVAIAILVIVAALGWGMYLKADSEVKSLKYGYGIIDESLVNMNLKYSELEGNYSKLEEELEELLEEAFSKDAKISGLEVELDSIQELLLEERRVKALLQERVTELGNQIGIQLEVIQSYISTIERLENEIDELLDPPQTRTIINLIGTCTRVIDGDTFELSSGKRVRLADIDAPESYEPGYSTSTNALSVLILGVTVYLDIDDISETDIYGRYVCVVYGPGYTNVNLALLTGGYAVQDDYPNEFDPDDWETTGDLDLSEAPFDTPSEPEPEPPEPAWEYHSTYRGIEIQVYNPGATSYRAYFNGGWTSSAFLNILRLRIDEYLDPEPEGIYVGSINSNKYHRPSCYWAGQINPENEIWFTSKSDAESHGYVPCKVCKP